MDDISQIRKTDSLQPQELKAIYGISRVILEAVDIYTTLQEIINHVRPIFIFDNVVLYQLKEDESLETTYAKAVGRGRSIEADLTWGEFFAREVLQKGEITTRKEVLPTKQPLKSEDRLRTRYFLGLPLRSGDIIRGVLVFIRFGGPDYQPDQVNLANFISEHFALLLERQHLVERIASLEAERKLAQLQEDFIAMVSHDLRSPLGFIKGYATTLLRDDITWDDDAAKEFLVVIDEEADRLSELIDNLLDSSRLQTGRLAMNFQPLRIETLLRDIVQRAVAGDNEIDINLNVDVQSTTVKADASRLVQVFDNLLSNASKYANGTPVSIVLSQRGDVAYITVSDKGPGIPPEYLEDIFKRFFRLPTHAAAGRGSGLGLYICRQIIDAHNGTLFATSAQGEGTTFHIELPRVL